MILKQKPWRLRAYLDWVKTLPCCHCREYGCDPHHLMVGGARGTGMTVPDFAAVPLCRKCHDKIQPEAQKYPQLRWLIETLNRAFTEGVLTYQEVFA